ncbi:hypothetical protein [Bradyrhizobium sp. USDA 313]|uniref:hypothetical protein n=1 Tax=Bradyrhizobium sp. USDA 313 TaxID=3156307 RepID=UPI003518CA9B
MIAFIGDIDMGDRVLFRRPAGSPSRFAKVLQFGGGNYLVQDDGQEPITISREDIIANVPLVIERGTLLDPQKGGWWAEGAAIGFDPTLRASTVTELTTTSVHQAITRVPGRVGARRFSVWAKGVNLTNMRLQAYLDNWSSGIDAQFSLADSSVAAGPSSYGTHFQNVVAKAGNLGNGWARYTLDFTTSFDGELELRVLSSRGVGYDFADSFDGDPSAQTLLRNVRVS